MRRRDITLAEQFEKRRNWKKPLVDSVVATFLYRRTAGTGGVLDTVEWYVTQRLKGAEPGQFQAHHGGFIEVTDTSIRAAAIREVKEEVGYTLNEEGLQFLAIAGPALYRSECGCVDGMVKLHISDVEAEPAVAFTAPLFLSDLTGFAEPSTQTDGEVARLPHSWLTAREIIKRWGKVGEREHSLFNYYQFFLPALQQLAGQWETGRTPAHAPGDYDFQF